MTRREPKIVAIGGGTGLSVILRGLKKLPVDITAIVTVADDGGSSGVLRDELNIPPPGDIRNVLAALSETEPLFEKLLQHRFDGGGKGLNGHSLGNLLLAAMSSISGDFVQGIRELSRVLNVKGKVLPAAAESIVLKAEMEDGTIVEGESAIPLSKKKIKRVSLQPEDISPLPESVEAVREADLIVIGPGSLYTSVMPNLLVSSLMQEICCSNAKKVYICNVMTQKGETDGFTAGDHVSAILDHVEDAKNCLDYIIVNNRSVPNHILDLYALEGAMPVHYDRQRLEAFGYKVVSDQIIKFDRDVIRHDEEVISRLLMDMVRHVNPEDNRSEG